MDLKGKVAIVTGGASGIGKAISETFLELGMKVCICDISELTTNAQTKFSKQFENNIYYVKCDVSNFEEFRGAFEKTKKAFGRIDVLVNNAGILNEHEWKRVIDINVVGAIHGTKLALEFLNKNQGGSGGHIINISSVTGIFPSICSPIYGASKHFVLGLTKSYGHPYHFNNTGVVVNAICPGPIDTPMLQNLSLTLDKKVTEEYLIDNPPISPLEVGKAAVKLLQDGKNGAALRVDHEGMRYHVTE